MPRSLKLVVLIYIHGGTNRMKLTESDLETIETIKALSNEELQTLFDNIQDLIQQAKYANDNDLLTRGYQTYCLLQDIMIDRELIHLQVH